MYRIVVAQTFGLGDLVLTAPLIAGLRAHFATSAVELVCRTPLASLPNLFPSPPTEVTTVGVYPQVHTNPSPTLLDQVRTVAASFRGRRAELFVAASAAPTWLDWFVAGLLRPNDAVAAPKQSAPRGLLRVLLDEFGVPAIDFRGPENQILLSEQLRYASLLEMVKAAAPGSFPWKLTEEAAAKTASAMRELGLEPRSYAVCFPSAPGTDTQRWTPERFWEILLQLGERFHGSVLLMGEASEAAELRALADCVDASVRVFAASPADLPVAAGLLANASLYFGNDCGFAHLAQCYWTPGVTLFGGGGGWPSHAAWAPGSISLANPLPCFDCGWDCPFARVHCLESIPTRAVLDAIGDIVADPGRPPEARALTERTGLDATELIQISDRYRRLRDEHAASASLVVELAHREAKHRRGWLSRLH